MINKSNHQNKRKHIGYSPMFSLITVIGITGTTGLVFFVMWFLSNDYTITLRDVTVITIFILTLSISIIFTFILCKIFISPLIKLTNAMNKVADGDFSIQLHCDSRRSDLFEVYESFNTMVKELANTDTLQSDFISNVSHEFKTPINAIEGYASLLQDSSLSQEDQDNYVNKIMFNTRRLSELVGNVLLLSKVSNQSIQPKLSTYRLDEQIRQSILALESRWEKKEIDFDVDMEALEFTGMENLLGHVWTNLIDNAIKFSDFRGEIQLRLFSQSQSVHFSIKNFGTTIPAESIENIFTKFYQCDSSRKSEGSGLGLALVKRIVEESNGSIEVSSSIENGTVFRISLPM